MKRQAINKKYHVTLTADERTMLHDLLAAGKAAARTLTHARILLKADASVDGPGWTDEAIREALDVGLATIGRVRQRFVEERLEAALYRQAPTRDYHHLVDGECEAHLIALACSTPPPGHKQTPYAARRHLLDKKLAAVDTMVWASGQARTEPSLV
jgi:hypothetical protein